MGSFLARVPAALQFADPAVMVAQGAVQLYVKRRQLRGQFAEACEVCRGGGVGEERAAIAVGGDSLDCQLAQ
ncbi:hypothetical protein Y88_2285 [Novosphingobium nitrogenifigens DSM 19370]|uniref:Uncharacterized protein n=1 Tax=Novosphingobium nitrogenifigens DSM 19370 TaxID=983920 RepID=F1Z663_9SPHN|nr:hypothetical protein Y88_2285 [Novosphingobium nitrogenifigens DSM 19370]